MSHYGQRPPVLLAYERPGVTPAEPRPLRSGGWGRWGALAATLGCVHFACGLLAVSAVGEGVLLKAVVATWMFPVGLLVMWICPQAPLGAAAANSVMCGMILASELWPAWGAGKHGRIACAQG